VADVGRPRGEPTQRCDLELEERQIERLEALRSVSPFGPPAFVVIVRRAVDFYLDAQEAQMPPEMRARYDKALRKPARKVVGLSSRKREEG